MSQNGVDLFAPISAACVMGIGLTGLLHNPVCVLLRDYVCTQTYTDSHSHVQQSPDWLTDWHTGTLNSHCCSQI